MKTGLNGTFVISWSQTHVDNSPRASVECLRVGANWRWTGTPLRVDGPRELADLESANAEQDQRRRMSLNVHMLVKAALDPSKALGEHDVDEHFLDLGFEITDGYESYYVSLITDDDGVCLLAFSGGVPPQDTDLRIIRVNLEQEQSGRIEDQPKGVIGCVSGTRLLTPEGEIRVERLREGDRVLTRDNAEQEVLWVGHRHLAWADMFDHIDHYPIKLHAGAIRSGQPDADMVVLSTQQILLSGARANDMFDQDEVLISACDLVDERRVIVDKSATGLTYYYVLLTNHEVVWCNGVPLETTHPSSGVLQKTTGVQLNALYAKYPQLDFAPEVYGEVSRPDVSDRQRQAL